LRWWWWDGDDSGGRRQLCSMEPDEGVCVCVYLYHRYTERSYLR
jgi:hypothetical protein